MRYPFCGWAKHSALAVLLSFLSFMVGPVRADYSVLHSFMGGTSDGATPYGALLLSGSDLYGMT